MKYNIYELIHINSIKLICVLFNTNIAYYVTNNKEDKQ